MKQHFAIGDIAASNSEQGQLADALAELQEKLEQDPAYINENVYDGSTPVYVIVPDNAREVLLVSNKPVDQAHAMGYMGQI